MKLFLPALGLLIALPLFGAESKPGPRSNSPTPSESPEPPASEPATAPTEDAGKPTASKAEQLAAAQKQLGILRLRHTEKHPSVLKQRAKVARLQKEVRDEEKQAPAGDRSSQLQAAKEELTVLREKFTDQHPAVIAQQRRIAELERR